MSDQAPELNSTAENMPADALVFDRKNADFLLFLWAVLAFLGGYIIIPMAAAPDDLESLPEYWEILLQPTVCGVILTMGAYRITGSWRQLAIFLQLDKWRWDLLWKCPLGALGLLSVIAVLTTVWGAIADLFQWDLGTPATSELALNGSPLQIAAMAVSAVMLAPLMEELLFRRSLFQALKHLSNGYIAGGITAMAFGAVHLSWLQLPGFIFVGIVWQIAVCRTQTLWSSILLHFFNNFWAVSALLLMKKFGLETI